MKKIVLGLSCLFLLFGCATMDNISKNLGPKPYTIPENYDEAYSYRTDSPYKNVNSLIKNNEKLRSSNPSSYVAKICESINQTAKNDFEKTKMAHDVVAVLISYDAENFWKGTIPEQDWSSVLKRKTAVCEGYSNLFKKFCDTLKINCEIVHGYARGVGTSLSSSENPKDSNHAWNLVRINDACYLVDTTWDSGFMDEKVSRQSYNTSWLFVKPEVMIYSHYPELSKYQLLENPVSAENFASSPDLRPKFFDSVSKFDEISKVNKAQDRFAFAFSQNDGYELSFQISPAAGEFSKSSESNYEFVKNLDGKNYEALFAIPAAGLNDVRIYYRKNGEKTGHSCGEFLVDASQKSNFVYPLTYSSSANDIRLFSPIEAPLKKGNSYDFSLYVGNKKYAAVVAGKKFIYLSNDGNGNFSGNVEIPKNVKSVKISVSNSERGSYEGLFSFPVK